MIVIKNWTGQKFFNLTILNKSKDKRGNKFLWHVLCDCGNVSLGIPYNIKTGRHKTCGQCSRPKQSKDWSNIRFYSITFIKPHKKNKNEQIVWEAICDCGKIIYTIPSNYTKSCGCLAKPASRERCAALGKAGRKYHPMISSARHLWRPYKKDSDLDFDTFYKLSQLNCFYCGSFPGNKYNHKDNMGRIYPDGLFIYNGLDRVDSNKGHNIDNVVTCCYDCNKSKMDKSVNEFLLHINRVYEHNKEKILALNIITERLP